jgi:SAM-dependent methyltransferase
MPRQASDTAARRTADRYAPEIECGPSQVLQRSVSVPQNQFVGRVAETYDATSPDMFDPAVIEETVRFLAAAAGNGPALEFGIGTGRIALPLSETGVEVHGIDISPDMIEQLRRKPGSEKIATTVGDFAETAVPGEFSLVYIVYNSICNLLEQAEWVQAFRNAARHLRAGGRFILELWVPDLRRFPPGAPAMAVDFSADHVGFDTLDIATQRGVSHHFWIQDGKVGHFDGVFRYAWPAELDLMAQLAGMTLAERWSDWDRSPFISDSPKHISVWKPT